MIKFAQTSSRYLGREHGRDIWRWSVALKADDPLELELVEKVVYTLHESYARPVRVVSTLDNGFELAERTNGIFTVKAMAVMRAGVPRRFELRLRLFYPPCRADVVYDDYDHDQDALPVS